MPVVRPGVQMVGGTRASVAPKPYTLSDFNLNVQTGSTKALTADGSMETLYDLDIEEGLGEMFGRGAESNPLQAQGFAGIRLVNDTAAAQAEGRYRLAVRNAQGRRLYNLYEGDLAGDDLYDAAGNLKDRKNRTPFPQTAPNFETKPHSITIDVDVASDITVDDAEATTAAKFDGYRAESLE